MRDIVFRGHFNVISLQLRTTLIQPLDLFPQHLPHPPRYLRAFLIIQIITLPSSKHRPALALNFRHRGRSRDDVEVHMRYDLRCSRAVVLDNIVVAYARDFRYGACE